MSKKGKVYLVGAGPGDPGLMTVRGLQVLREADFLVADALVSEELLDEVKPGCHVVDAGKRSGRHRLKQDQITKLLIREAKKGRRVVRLKGGDPSIFGRGGEEGAALRRAKIPFEFVPGVSSVTAVPVYAGISLTHRDLNSSVTLLSGCGENQDLERELTLRDWEGLARQETLIMLMGMKDLVRNMKALIRHGKKPKTPVAVIQWGTLPEQRTVLGDLESIAGQVRREKLQAPAVIVIGEIVRLRPKLNWFESKPLFAKHILVTRSRHHAGELTQRLRGEAARVTEIPTIELRPPRSWRPLDQAISRLADFSWVIFTSMNGVGAFFERLDHHGLDARALGNTRIAVIGPATARRLTNFGVRVDVMADSYRAEGILKKLSNQNVKNQNILIARAAQARSILPDELKKGGAKVTVAPCYCSAIPSDSRSELKRLIREDPPDLLTFASSSMVNNFSAILKKDSALWRRARKIPTACIGPITAKSAKDNGLNIVVQPKKYTIPDLVDAIRKAAKKI